MNNEPLDLNWQNAAELTPPPFRLAETDEDYLEAHARQTQRDAFAYGFERKDRCSACGHGWHGLTCTGVRSDSQLCPCKTSWKEDD